jgi:hypothetical protein
MKWTYSISNKFLASVVLFALCLLVLLSNYLDRIHTRNVKNAIATLYEDRLIAEDYILKMTINVYQIREILNADLSDVSKSTAIGKPVNDFNDWYSAYIKTKLTASEKAIAMELRSYFKSFEQHLLNHHYLPSEYTEKALHSLSRLSTVQVEESKLIMQHAESEYATIKASSQFAFAVTIVILVVLQAIVFSSKTLIQVTEPKAPTLN